MKKIMLGLVFALLLSVGFMPATTQAAYDEQACWGQATKVFAMTGEMGKHASQQPTPRAGLKNLANALYANGDIDEPTLQALAAYVLAADPTLSLEPCEIDQE